MFGGFTMRSGINFLPSLITKEEGPIYLLAKVYEDSLNATTLLALPN
jgi:hypothetical protein